MTVTEDAPAAVSAPPKSPASVPAPATGLASLSYQLIEQPIRTADWIDRWRTAPVAVGLVASVLVALVVAPGLLERPTSAGALETSAPAAGGSDRVPPVEVLQTAWSDYYDYGSFGMAVTISETQLMRTPPISNALSAGFQRMVQRLRPVPVGSRLMMAM